jgi:CRP-like cAMP-binding protein
MTREETPGAAESSLFGGLAPEVVTEVLGAATVRELVPGESLFLQGDEVSALYVVDTGRLKLAQVTAEGEEVVVGTLGAGAILAGVAVLDKRVLPVSALAVVPSRVYAWPRALALELVARHPTLRTNVLTTIADRMQGSLRRIRELSTESAGQRVARVLLRLTRESGRPVDTGTLIDQPLGRQEVAELAGASMFTASRLLAQWAREGILEVGRQRVVVRSLDRLIELAGEARDG